MHAGDEDEIFGDSGEGKGSKERWGGEKAEKSEGREIEEGGRGRGGWWSDHAPCGPLPQPPVVFVIAATMPISRSPPPAATNLSPLTLAAEKA